LTGESSQTPTDRGLGCHLCTLAISLLILSSSFGLSLFLWRLCKVAFFLPPIIVKRRRRPPPFFFPKVLVVLICTLVCYFSSFWKESFPAISFSVGPEHNLFFHMTSYKSSPGFLTAAPYLLVLPVFWEVSSARLAPHLTAAWSLPLPARIFLFSITLSFFPTCGPLFRNFFFCKQYRPQGLVLFCQSGFFTPLNRVSPHCCIFF